MKQERIAQDLVLCVPLPDWVDQRPYRSAIPDTETACVANGTCRLLNDIQINLCVPEPAWHCRTVRRVLTREGAAQAAHFAVEFDPGYQRLEIHFVRVIRGEERIEHAKPEALQLLRRETNLERLVFDGRLTVSLLIPDVRIDDLVEVGLTFYGNVPVLGGRYVSWLVFDGFNPWFESRQRLMRPRGRRTFMKEYNGPPRATIAESAEMEDLRWQLVGQPRREAEVVAPPWLILNPVVQLSEFESWNEVASLLAPFYESDALPEALAAEVDRLSAAHREPAERAVEWLRFVQRELRYFAFSLGEGGLTPRTLEAIWGTRFGDCKDAARLYAAGARRLGLDACAALVSTTHGFVLNELIPSSAIFNHCIVRLRLNGVSYWLDPTMPSQSGTLQNVAQLHAGWALPLDPEVAALEKMADDQPLHVLHWEDDVTLGPKRGSPAIIHRRIDYSFWAADAIRNRIANEGANNYAQALLKEVQALWPGAVETASIEVRDDLAGNVVTLLLGYEIRDCWKPREDGSGVKFTIGTGISRDLQLVRAVPRESDIYLGSPRTSTSHLRINMPCRWHGNGWSHRLEATGMTYQNHFKINGRTITDSRELTIDAWTIPAKDVERYNDVAHRLQEHLLIIWARERFGRIRPQVGRIKAWLGSKVGRTWFPMWFAWIVVMLLTMLIRHLQP